MCGIGGWFGRGAPIDLQALGRSIAHRGPDGAGTWEDPAGCAGMVHTRLSILDLTEAGSQPMSYSAKGNHDDCLYQLTFNGEIYNFRELRAALEEQGESFVGNSDTEVLLRLLVREGVAALPKLAGMFAFAFWDPTTKKAILARDGLGIKPLYYSTRNGQLIFASEFRSLQSVASDQHPNVDAVRDFLLWGSFQEPATLVEEIHQLEAGSFLEWHDGHTNIVEWYRPEFDEYDSHNRQHSSRATAVTSTRNALLESVQRHLVSDVPIGIFLSGGIDSTSIVALAREILGANADLRTFSIAFEEAEFDESPVIQKTVERFKTNHTQWMMTSAEGAAEVEPYLAAMDQPTTDGFNTWCVSKMARRGGVKVVLSGLGGDELFAGYDSFRQLPRLRFAHKATIGTSRLLGMCLKRVTSSNRFHRLAAFLQGNGGTISAYHTLRGFFTPDEANHLVRQLLNREPSALEWHEPGVNHGNVVSFLEMTRYMRNQLLRDSDVFSMAQGLELRVPFVDTRLFQTLATIPASIRLRQGKQLLLEAVPEVPQWVREQPKRGFRFPFQKWMNDGFGDMLAAAERVSDIPLTTWYRRWAVATIQRRLESLASCQEVFAQ